MERRMFLGALAGASLALVSEGPLADLARPQHDSVSSAHLAGPGDFQAAEIEVSGNAIFLRRYGKGPAILLVHGFPRT